MAIASGLGASLGIAAETTVGTIVSPTRWVEFNSESLSLEKTVIQGQGLRGSGLYGRASRRVVTGRNAGGVVEMDLATSGLGLLYRQMLGSTSTSTLVSGTAYQQVHTPGANGQLGKSLTVQKLVPNRAGTLVPFTYNGCKITAWEIACEVGGIATLSVTFDAWDEVTTTAAGTPSYTSSTGVFHFRQGTLSKGGTVSTSAGLTTVTGATAFANVRGVTVMGDNAMTTGEDNQRFNSKAEQTTNDWSSLTGSLDVDFVDQSSVYDLFSADTATALTLSFVGTTAISGAVFPTLEIILPNIRFDGSTPQVGGPDLVALDAGFTALDDGTNPPVQIRSVTADTSIS